MTSTRLSLNWTLPPTLHGYGPEGQAPTAGEMYYNYGLSQWELEGGNGLVRYTQSSSFDPNGPNIFDVLLLDLTLQAPSSITVFPLSPLPCDCPGTLEPPMGAIPLTAFAPLIRGGPGMAMPTLALMAYAPKLSSPIPSHPCGSYAIPDTLTMTLSGFVGDSAGWNGLTFTLVYDSGLGYWLSTPPNQTSGYGDLFNATVACVVACKSPIHTEPQRHLVYRQRSNYTVWAALLGRGVGQFFRGRTRFDPWVCNVPLISCPEGDLVILDQIVLDQQRLFFTFARKEF